MLLARLIPVRFWTRPCGGCTEARLVNACQQALLLLERERFTDDPEAKIVRAVLRGAVKEGGAHDSHLTWLGRLALGVR